MDLDEIHNYLQIHGLDTPPDLSMTAVYDVAVDRLLAWGRAEKLPLTFFVVGSDLERALARDKIAEAARVGTEIANHTYSHFYDLTRRPKQEAAADIARGAEIIEMVTGKRPLGFRAPGYTITNEIFETLVEQGYAYDSSVFPCPAYYTAKTAMIGAIRARGRESRSVVDDPRVLTAPIVPYRVGTPYWKRGEGLLEVPIQVTTGARLPVIGTSLMLAGVRGSKMLAAMCTDSTFNLELHGVDVLDETDGLAPLAKNQKDLRIRWARKLEILSAVVAEFRARGGEFVTLERLAASKAHSS